jgi:ribonuclease E
MTEADAGDHPAPAPSTPSPSAGSEPTGPATTRSAGPAAGEGGDGAPTGGGGSGGGSAGGGNRRRGSRGGRNRNRPRPQGEGSEDTGSDGAERSDGAAASAASGDPGRGSGQGAKAQASGDDDRNPELPEKHRENKPSAEAAEAALVRKPQIGDSRPAPASAGSDGEGGGTAGAGGEGGGSSSAKRRRRRGGRGRGGGGQGGQGGQGGGTQGGPSSQTGGSGQGGAGGGQRQGGRRGASPEPVTAITDDAPVDLDEKTMSKRRGRERKGRPVGRYLMAVHVQPGATQIAVLEGRSLIEHYVSRPSDDVSQIHGNIYLGRVQNVLPGMEAAFVDIGTPKNAVLYRGDTRYDPEDLDDKGADKRIEEILKARQTILCQVTKNPIGAKGARLTQEISLPGRFVVLVPNSSTYGISKRLPDNERKRLRQVLDKAKPQGHGLIVRTAAEGISAEELTRDVERLVQQWEQIEALAAKTQAPALLYRDPDMSIRVIREEFNQDYRQVVIDDEGVYEQVRDYVRSISPALVERVVRYDPAEHGGLPLFETFHVHEQLHKAIDRKVWLPSGGSLIIERTEALTVIDVNTGKNVGKSSLEETVFKNNLEAAEEVARQLRLRDIGGIIVIDFIDMEVRSNRDQVIATFRKALARDKTRTQVFDISELGLVEMTRKRIGEGLIESLSTSCPHCDGRGLQFDQALTGQ